MALDTDNHEKPMDTYFSNSLAAVSWWLGGMVLTVVAVWALLGKFSLAAGIGAIDTLLKVGVFYGHQRLWGTGRNVSREPLDYRVRIKDLQHVE